MTDEQKQVLIKRIEQLKEEQSGHWTGHCPGNQLDQEIWKIALTALTAPPYLVLRPFGEDSQNTFIKCENNHPLAMKLFTRPAPAADLAELVPGEMTKSLASIANEYQTSPQNALFIVVGWNACRAAILRNIEEAR